MENKSRQIFIAAGVTVVAVVLFAVYYFVLREKPKIPEQETGAAETITKSATEGVLEVDTNPLKNAPDINPTRKTNPYSNVKTNPFE